MGRKGSQSKSVPNHAPPNRQNAANDGVLNTPESDVMDSEYQSSHVQGGSNGSGGNYGQKTKGSRKNSRSNGISSSGKSDERASKHQSVDSNCDISNSGENELSSSTPKVRRDSKKSSRRGSGKNSSIEQTAMPVFAEKVLERTRCIACMAASIFRASVLYIMEESKLLMERNRPAITTFMAIVHKGCDYVLGKIGYAYPICRAWIFNAGKLMLLLLAVWFNCNIRGFDSLLRLGTNSLLAVVWCSTLSIFAMIGLKKMLLFMGICGAVVVFVGLGFAVLVIALAAVLILWLYGSFWTTSVVIILGGVSFFLKHERFALLVTCLYSMYCAKCYVGWLGLLLSLNLSFISSDVLVQFLKNNVDDNKSTGPSRNSEQNSGRSGFFGESQQSSADSSQSGYGQPSDRGPGDPSTSGAEKELTSEEEVSRLLTCTDHYSALGFSRYENIDVSLLKREYKKKAMLVHPDKNMGNDKAADAFKKLQNAYEVLLDSLKRKTYDDELRREELLNYFRRPSEGVDEGPFGLSRRIVCKKCGDFHLWIYTGRAKAQARWCQDCKDFHQAKDGDGWVEQSFQPVLFGLLQKPDLPHAYVCAESNIFDVTEWFSCQGMRCPANTHKPSFHVNASLAKQNSGKGSTSAQRGGGAPNGANMDGGIDEEFFEWLQNAVQSGMFEAFGAQNEPPSPGSGSNAKGSNSSSKKKKKGKKQW
uniref:J domain-containing protein n=1 Tax=Leersia perrieri TaxID=77586 RepID=A0A0D9XDI7_9ORYZ